MSAVDVKCLLEVLLDDCPSELVVARNSEVSTYRALEGERGSRMMADGRERKATEWSRVCEVLTLDAKEVPALARLEDAAQSVRG